MNGHPVAPCPKPWESLGSVLGFPNEDEEFWWKTTAPVLGKFLIKADYSVEQQFSYLSWYHRYILSSYGPRPEQGKERTWRAQCTPNANPFQPSWNLQNNKSTVRFTIEPIGHDAGTRLDPFNQKAAFDLMHTLKAALPGVQDSWFHHCARALYVPKDLVNIMLAVQGPPKGPKPPTCFLAFDLDATAIETKAYFFPHIQAWNLGVTQGDLIIDTVRGLNSDEIDLTAGLDAFEEYLGTPDGPVSHRNVEMLAIDCVAPRRARAKIYVNSFNNSFAKIRDLYTMGGRLGDAATLASLGPLAQLWKLLYDMPEKEGWEKVEIPSVMHHRSCFVIGYEFKTGEPLPTTKIYFPLWHYAKTDEEVARALATFYGMQGWGQLEKSYRGDVEEML